MFKNYLKIAWRHFIKNRQFTLLNLIGLSTGLACALMIYLWAHDELTIDKFHEKDSRLYQVIKTSPNADGTIHTHETTPCLLAQAMRREFPEVEYAVPVVEHDNDDCKGICSAKDKHIKAMALFAGADYLNAFSYPLLQGNKNNILSGKHNVLLSSKLALKLFSTTKNIIGQTVAWHPGNELDGDYIVSGVFESPPANATAQFDLVFNFDLYFDTFKDHYDLATWYSNNPSTYVVLKEGTNLQQFNQKIKDFTKLQYKAAHGAKGVKWEGDIFLQRYSEKYLYNRYENGVIAGGRIEYVRLFSIIAVFILVIACINFMNLTTAQASKRCKEVGIKKVAGARRRALVIQYLGESIFMSFLSLAIAVVLIAILLPAFNQITGKQLTFHFSSRLVLFITGITLLTGIIAGSYPALYLSGFRPAPVLKGQLKTSAGELWIRKGLVVFQFALSAIFIVSVLVVYQQMQLIQTKNLGYNKGNIIRFASEGNIRNNMPAFLAAVRNIPGVVNASSIDGDLTGMHSGGGGINWEGKQAGVEFAGLYVDFDLLETLGVQMAAGRSYSRQFASDSHAVRFNEAAIAAMALRDPVGKTVTMWGRKEEIIGVVKNFHFESLYNNVRPFFFRFSQQNSNILVKINAGMEKETINRLAEFYKQYNLGLPFEYAFLDDDYRKLYASEQRVAVLSKYFAALAIIISCLGLFGLAAFTAQRRQKEIGIRKVMGATLQHIVAMLSKDFLKLVLIAVLVAFPVAWWVMHQWLHQFAYRIYMGAGIFLAAGTAVIFITLFTISFQSVKAAIVNPAKSLRTE